LAIVALLLSAGLVRADEKQKVEAILAKGISALGGEAKLSKYKAATWKATMNTLVGDMETEIIAEMALQWPQNIRFKTRGANFSSLDILSGDKGWKQTDQGTEELDERLIVTMQRALYFEWIPATLLPLREKDFKLAVGSEGKVNGRPAASIKVTPPRGPAFELFFDKENGLPAKMAMRSKDEKEGTEYSFAWVYSDYKEVQGIKKAMKIVIKDDYGEGKTSAATQITEFRFFDKLEDKVFAKP
jgi:hypothetical protein